MKSNVADFLLQFQEPDRLAFRLLDRDYTYGELERAVQKIAHNLEIRPRGERVLLIADNSFFWAAAYLGVMRAGLVVVPLPAGISASEASDFRESTGAESVFIQRAALARKAACFAGMDVVTDAPAPPVPQAASQQVFAMPESENRYEPAAIRASGDDLAALMFTSGSTGEPRGVMISHANIIANTESIIDYLRLNQNDRVMAILPFHYCFGASLLHTHLRVGASMVIDSRFMYPEIVLERMIETGCTGFAGVPSHFQILLRSSSLRKKSFPRLRYVQQAGGALAAPFLCELRQALPETEIYVMYGQTEATARLAYLPPQRLASKPGSIGQAIPGVRLRVLDGRGQMIRPGSVGEIVAEGPNIARGYWRAPEESAATFRNGCLYTGDLATVDSDGFLYIVDRAKDFLKCRGERISCRQLEEKLLESEEVLEAAVVAVSDPVLGEAVKAFVVPSDPTRHGLRGRVLQFCRERWPPHLVPKEIVVLSALPKNGAGKVLKAALRAA